MPKISSEKSLSKIEEYLGKVERMQGMSYSEGENLREELNISIRTLIPLAFEDGEKKVKEFDDYVNWYIEAVGKRKSPAEEQRDYKRRVKDTKNFLNTWKDELELTSSDPISYPIPMPLNDVSRILMNFESDMKRWVWHGKKKWLIENEYDIQSIIFLVLRSYFTDLEYEDPNPKFGHSYSKVDFKIPSLKLCQVHSRLMR